MMTQRQLEELERLNALESQLTRDLALDLSPAGVWVIGRELHKIKESLEKIWREIDGGNLTRD